jgi:hypothetical protein
VLATESASGFEQLGAACFGVVIGWFTYYVNRYRSGPVRLADLGTMIGAVGGAAVMALFPAKTKLFAAYGVGLALGFFGYFVVLLVLVAVSREFTVEWFLDGRRKKLPDEFEIPTGTAVTRRAMGTDDGIPR